VSGTTLIEMQRLLDDLCLKLGFCLAPEEQERLRTSVVRGADAITEAVLLAEGIDAALNKRLRRQVMAVVEQHVSGWS